MFYAEFQHLQYLMSQLNLLQCCVWVIMDSLKKIPQLISNVYTLWLTQGHGCILATWSMFSSLIKPGGCCINIWLSHSFFKWIKPITCDKVYLCTAYIQSVQKWYIVSQSSFALQQLNVTLTRGKIDFQFKNTLHPKAVKLKKRLDSKDLLRLSQADTLPSASQS